MTGVRIGHPRAHAEAVVRLAGEIHAGTRPLSASHAGGCFAISTKNEIDSFKRLAWT